MVYVYADIRQLVRDHSDGHRFEPLAVELVFDAPANNGPQLNVLDDGASLEYVSILLCSK